ncbi:MAG: CaiB/BaiF CoA transferase family protein, partial [Myxococcota bacterium]
MGALYVNNNRNKRAVALDVKSDSGKEVLTRLIRRSDVLLHNMRPAAAQRLGVAFEAAAAINPRLIYCSAVGFGQRGRYRGRPAFDDVIQAAAGVAGISERDGEAPRFIPTILADKVGALHAVYGILAALVARAHGTEGALRVEVPMFETLASFILNEHLAGATFDAGGRVGYSRVLSPDRRPYRTRDGWIYLMCNKEKFWPALCEKLGRREWIEDARFRRFAERLQHRDLLTELLDAELARRTTDEWLAHFAGAVPAAPIYDLAQALENPFVTEHGRLQTLAHPTAGPYRMVAPPVRVPGEDAPARPAPALGEHTEEI